MSPAKPQSVISSSGAAQRARVDAQFELLRRAASGGDRLAVHRDLEVRWSPIAQWQGDPAAWRDLMTRVIEPNVFLEPGFAFPAANKLGPPDLGVLSVYHGAKLVGLLPGRVEGFSNGRAVPMFVAWTHPFAPMSSPLLDRELAADAVSALIASMGALPGSPKAALFPYLPDTSVAARLIGLDAATKGQAVTRLNIHARAALVRIDDEPLSMVSPRKRKELGRQRRRLAETGHLEHIVSSEPRDIRAAVADFIALEERGWKGRSGGAAARTPAAEQFMTDAVVALSFERKARIDRMRFDDRTIAATITLYSGDYAWFWKIAYEEEFARFSPGVQIALDLTDVLEADRNLALVDSCAVADHPMIDHMWAGRINMADWLVPLDSPASFAVAAASERARRAALAPIKALRRRLRRR
jgi:CelD/BcsL family acetyltransferase involved in cellulose biosynthesis